MTGTRGVRKTDEEMGQRCRTWGSLGDEEHCTGKACCRQGSEGRTSRLTPHCLTFVAHFQANVVPPGISCNTNAALLVVGAAQPPHHSDSAVPVRPDFPHASTELSQGAKAPTHQRPNHDPAPRGRHQLWELSSQAGRKNF